MSGIVGLHYPDERPVLRDDLSQMLETISHRGPDRSGVWFDGSAGLGHRMLWTTPESLNERLPLVDQNTGCSITADARIDNRKELLSVLNFANRKATEVSDSEIILDAYYKWGKDCPAKLVGDFAFAIWDSRTRSLFCARDHFGVKPFYYYSANHLFAFASEIKALMCLPEVPRRLDDMRVADYLGDVFSDLESTLYERILRLPPGHSLTMDQDGLSLQSYWSLDPSRDLRLSSDREYAEAFLEIFTEAVDCRLRSAFPVGSMLSGGLDSSSIVCTARKLLNESGARQLHTFSAVFDKVAQCDERSYINTVIADNGLQSHYVNADQTGPLTLLDKVLWHEDGVIPAPNLFLHWRLFGAAVANGARIVLDGHDGDSAVSHGPQYLNELAREQRWLALAVEARGVAATHHCSYWKLLNRFAWHFGINPVVQRHPMLKRSRRVYRAAHSRILTNSAEEQSPFHASLNSDFAKRTNLAERCQTWRKSDPWLAKKEREGHFRLLTQAFQPRGLEVLDHAAAAFSIEQRYPFRDKRLVEFCLALPPEQKLHHGWGRVVMRRAMKGLLPRQIQWRRGKMDFSPLFCHGLLNVERPRLDNILQEGLSVVEDYIDTNLLRQTYQRFVSKGSHHAMADAFAIWKGVSLAAWLQN